MIKRIFFIASCLWETCFWDKVYGMTNLTDTQTSRLYKQVVCKQFIKCEDQVKLLRELNEKKVEFYKNKIKEQLNDEDYCQFSHYSEQLIFWKALERYLLTKDNTDELIRISKILGLQIQKAVQTLISQSALTEPLQAKDL